MNDLFKSFSFDIQRFATIPTSSILTIASGESSAASTGRYYWEDYKVALVKDNNSSIIGSASNVAADADSNVKQHYTIAGESITSILLDGKGNHNLTIETESVSSASIKGLGNVTLNIIGTTSGTSATTLVSGLKFSGAGSNDFIGTASLSTGAATISLVTKDASLTLARANTSIGSGTNATPVSLTINDSQIEVVNTGYTFVYSKRSGNDVNTLILDTEAKESAGVAVTSGPSSSEEGGSAYIKPAKAKTDQMLTIGEDTVYKFVNTTGNVAFAMSDSTTASGFNFGGTGDKLYLDTNGLSLATPVSALTYGTSYTAFNSGISLSGVSSEDGYLEMTGATSFVLGSLAAGDSIALASDEDDSVSLGVLFATESSGGTSATAGGSVAFDAKTAKLTSVTALSGAVAQITGASKFTINGESVDVRVVGSGEEDGTVTLSGASLMVEYDYTDDTNPILDLSGDENASVIAVTVNSAGGAKQLNIGESVTTAKIGNTTFNLAYGEENSEYGGAFVLDGNEATGFIFNAGGSTGASGTTTLIFDKGVPSNFTLYEKDSDSNSEISGMPKISGNAKVAVGVTTAEASSSTSLVVGQGAVLTFDDGTVLDFGKIGKNDYAKVLFNNDGVTYITGYVDNSNGGISAAVTALTTAASSAFTAGSYIKVTGNTAESATDGIIFGVESSGKKDTTVPTAKDYIATAKGNYTYTYGENGAITITLAEKDDTVYSAGAAVEVIPVKGGGTISYNEDVDYVYSNGGKAYFTADTATGALNGFVFAAKDDAVTLTEYTPATFALNYVTADGESATLASPTVSDGDRTITMTIAPANRRTATFELSGIEAEATATFGSNSDTYEFSAEGGKVQFTAEGVIGFTATEGTVTLDETAAGHLAATDDVTFKINGTEVNITAQVGEDGLIYNKDDNSLLGLAGGTAVVNAGDIAKIYVTGEAAEYTFGEEDSAVEFTITASGTSEEDSPFFTLTSGKPSGFTFAQENDELVIPAENFPADFKLFDTAEDTTGFATPKVTSGENAVGFTVTKTENDAEIECFAITIDNGFAGTNIEFADGAKADFVAASGDNVEVFFSTKGNLLDIVGLTAADDEVEISGATEAVDIDEHEISIVGGAFTYKMQDASTPSIIDVTAGTQIVTAEGITQFWTTNDSVKGNGEFTFGASSVYTIAGMSTGDVDGIRFDYADGQVTGISSVDGNASVTGALAELETLDGEEFVLTAGNSAAVYTFSGTSLAGLADGDEVIKAANISDFITAGSGSFTILESELTIDGDEQVKFIVDGGALSAIEELDGTAIGDFTKGLLVDDETVKVTGDSTIEVSATVEDGITSIAGVSGTVTLEEIGSAKEVSTDGDGIFTFTAAGVSFTTENSDGVKFAIDDSDFITKITGLDKDGEALSGNFDEAITVNGSAIQVEDEDGITVTNTSASGLIISKMSDGAELLQAEDVKLAKTDEVSGSAEFTFVNGAFSVAGDDDGIEFVLDGKGNVVSINDLDDTATITGDLNNIAINGKTPAIVVKSATEESGYNTNLTYEDGVLTGLVDGDTVVSADGVSVVKSVEAGTFTFGNGSFSVADDEEVSFQIKVGTANVVSVSDLDEGAKLSGNLGALSAINGASVIIKNDTSFAVVGAAEGISQILDLSDGAEVVYAGGALSAVTDKAGTFTFAGGQSFKTALDDEVTFLLDGETVTGIEGFSGLLTAKFDSIVSINDKTFDIEGDSDKKFGIVGTNAEDGILSIAGVGGSAVTINDAGGASFISTNAEGKYTFAKSGQEFTTDDSVLSFTVDENETVTEIELLEKSITGDFSDVAAVNGVSFTVEDDDDSLTVYGNKSMSGIAKIADVDGGATITDVGGASQVVTKSEGEFTFAGHSNPFEILGDSSVTFEMDTAQKAVVVGVKNFGDEGAATINGELGKVSIGGISIDIDGDEDELFSYKVDANGKAILGGIGGDEVVVNGLGGASKFEIVQDGIYTFGTSPYTLSGGDDYVVFGKAKVEDLNGTIEGNFSGSGTINGKELNISGDSVIGVVGNADGSAISEIFNLSDGATILAAEGVSTAKTDGNGKFTFADEREIEILGSESGVTFELDGKGNLVSIDGVDDNTTVKGDLNGLDFTGGASIDVRDNVNLWYNNGTLSGVVAGDTVISADGATLVVAQASDGLYNFGSGSTAQSFELLGDSGIIAFRVEDGNKVVAITGLDEGAAIVGKLNGIAINGGGALDIEGDADEIFGVIAGADSGVAIVTGVGGDSGVTVNSVGGASILTTDLEGKFTFASGQKFTTEDDAEVSFALDGDEVTAISALSGIVSGDFEDGLLVNGEQIQVAGDNDDVDVQGNGKGVVSIADVDAGATVKAWGSAENVLTDGEGEFTFDNGELPAQKFEIAGDSAATFLLSGDSSAKVGVAGVSALENGTLKFDTVTAQIEVNPGFNDLLTFDTTEDVTLTIVDSKVVGLSGITGGVSGVQDATVAATGSINVNGKVIDITDADDSFNVIVENGGVSKITDVTGDATVNVTDGTIETDKQGTFTIGGQSWTFSDDDEFSFTTDANQQLEDVTDFSGAIEFSAASAAFTVNGEEFAVASASTSDPYVKLTTDGEDITAVEGLESGDSVSGDLDNAEMTIAGSSASVKGEGSFLTVNGNEYQLLGDEDGVTLDGANNIVGLDENASLIVGDAGDYTVNGTSEDLDSLKAGNIIIGGESGTDAYPYDGENLLVRDGTPVEEIENMLGIPNFDGEEFGGPRDGVAPEPLTKEESDALFDTVSPADLDKPGEFWLDNANVKDVQNLDFSNTDFTKKVTLYEGSQNLKFNDEFGNEVVIDDEATGVKNIEFGDGGNVAVIDGEASLDNEVNITSGAGDDSIFVRDNVAVNFDMSEGGADLIITWAGANARVKLEGYDYTTGAGIKIDERKAKDIATAIANGSIKFGEGVISIISGSDISLIDVGTTLGGTLVNLFGSYSAKQVVGFTNSAGGQVGDASATENLIIFGNGDGKKSGPSTLIGGAGNDTAFAGAGDNINLGGGENLVELEENDDRGGATINIGTGRTTINNMNNTLDEKHGDRLVIDLTKAEIKFDGTNLIVEGEDFYAIAPNADKQGSLNYSSDLASSADTDVENLVAGTDYTNQLIQTSDGATWKGSFAKDEAVIKVESDEDIRANYYKGNNIGVTFVGYAGSAIVDLANDGEWIANSSIDGKAAVFDGVVSLKAGAAGSRDQFKGSANSETLMAGQGYASLYGDGGNNLLVGYNGTDGDKEGQTTFLILGNAEGAANTITGFEFVSDDNYTATQKVTADKLEVDLNTNHVSRIDISDGSDVLIEVINNTNGITEKALIEDAVGKDIMLSDLRDNSSLVAQVNTDTLDFDRFANYYYATEKNATLSVDDENIQDNASIWLGGELGDEFVGDFRVIDATNFSGKAELAGNSLNNTIIAGSGETSLWGGANGDDVMISGTGKNTFFYALGNGNDTVEGAKDGDVVNLAVALDHISETEIDGESISIKFTDGGSLTVNDGGANVSFQVQGDNDAIYTADRDSNTWVKKA